jgi:hypothetical protein
MARTIYIGGLEELARIADTSRLVPGTDYVFGQYTEIDDMPEAGLMWFDLHCNYRRAKLTMKQRFAHEHYIKLEPIAEIARLMGITPQATSEHIRAAIRRLDGLGPAGLGVWTCYIERVGSWASIRSDIENKD